MGVCGKSECGCARRVSVSDVSEIFSEGVCELSEEVCEGVHVRGCGGMNGE